MSDIVFADAETRSLADLPAVGAYKYAKHLSTDVLVWGFAFDDELPQVWSPAWAWGNTDCSRPDVEPTALLDHIENGGYFVAWNAFFDRHIWNAVMVEKYGWPKLRIEQVLCAQAQAEANNLPAKLEKACDTLGTSHVKDPAGQRLIGQLCMGDRSTWDSAAFETPEKMGHFRVYCARDITSMRDVFQCTRPLVTSEWEEYHASERINDRGVMVDVDFAKAAAKYAAAEAGDINAQLAELTGDDKITITNHLRKARWAHDQLWPDEEVQMLTKRPPKDDKERFSCDRPTREAVLDLLSTPEHGDLFEPDHLDTVIKFFELIEAGNSAAVHKYTAIANTACDDRVHGMYAFNGAGQTGRFCVAAETLIETARGPQRIDTLSVGDLVWTHCGRLRPVVAKCTEGSEQMYETEFAHGETLICTANHRIMVGGVWQRVCEQNAFKRRKIYEKVSRLLPIGRLPDCRRRWREIWRSVPHGGRLDKETRTTRCLPQTRRRQQISIEDGPEQPDVRRSDGWRDTARKILGAFRPPRREICWGASTGADGATWFNGMAGWLGSSPHQRRPDRQSPGQSGLGNSARPPVITRPKITRITAVGTRTVWDITVAEDSSYIAAGVAHHNSSRGVQTHNLIRAPLDYDDPNRAMDAIDDIIAGVEPDELVEEYGFPISRLLARLLRPTFVAPEGKLLVWGDWDQIEARVLPWLADSPAADQKLDLFRTGQDVYKYAAAPIFGAKPDDIDDQQRQIGKVSELALGFGGANGAFAAMGRGYGIALPTSQVTQIVQAWRKQNDWCVQFWYKLWDAAMAAFNHPSEWYSAGRVKYLYHPNLMRGTLICMLPDGRWLVYPQFKHERAIVKVKKNGVETEEIKWRTTFVKGFAGGAGRVELWYGVLAENITQAVAASFLRDALAECDAAYLPVVLHTHDEIVVECDDFLAPSVEGELQTIMEYIPDWADGLPLSVSVESGPFYSK